MLRMNMEYYDLLWRYMQVFIGVELAQAPLQTGLPPNKSRHPPLVKAAAGVQSPNNLNE